MLVEIGRKELAKALRIAAKSVGKGSSMEILKGIKLVADGDCLTVTTTNLEALTVTKVVGEVAEPGEFLVNFSSLKKVVDKAKCETVILGGNYQAPSPKPKTDEIPDRVYVDNPRHYSDEFMAWKEKWDPVLEAWNQECLRLGEESVLTIEDDGSTTLSSMQLEEYPAMPKVSSVHIATLTGKALREAVEKAASMTLKAGETTHLALTSINLVLDHPHHSLVLVATDGYRLTKETIDWVRADSLERIENFSSVLIPANPWNSLTKSIGMKEEVTLGYDKEQGFFAMSVGETTFLLRKINEDFPDFERVIPPDDSPYKLTLDQSAFLAAVERGEIVASEETGAITLQAKGDGRLCLLSSSREKGSYREAIALLNGFHGTCGISFRGEYLVDFCEKHKANEIELILGGPDKAAIFRPVDSEDEVCVLMPVRDIKSYGREGEGDAVEWSTGELPEPQDAPEHVDCYDILRYSAEEELEEAAIMA